MPQIVSPPKDQEPVKRPIITTCPHCQYTISYTEDEVERVNNESMGVYCPQCGGVIETKHVTPFTFPDTFYYCGTSNGAVRLSDEKVQSYVDIVKRKLQQELKLGEYIFAGAGDTMVFGFKFKDEDEIVVVRDYWTESMFYD